MRGRKRLRKKKAKDQYFNDFAMYLLEDIAKSMGMSLAQLREATKPMMYVCPSKEGADMRMESLRPGDISEQILKDRGVPWVPDVDLSGRTLASESGRTLVWSHGSLIPFAATSNGAKMRTKSVQCPWLDELGDEPDECMGCMPKRRDMGFKVE